jgi:hypothetical protein
MEGNLIFFAVFINKNVWRLNMEIKLYLTNLAQYNAGSLVGKWLELPIDEEYLEKGNCSTPSVSH